jgi:anti-anti-sigma factor
VNSSNFFIKNKAKHMNAIHRMLRNGVAIERVDIIRATLNEAQEITHNLLDDISNYKEVIVDLSICDYIDSTFFGAMVSAYKRIRAKGGSIVLIVGKTFLSKSFIFKDITSVFKVYHSLNEAIRALKTPNQNVANDYKSLAGVQEPVKIVQTQLILNPE